MRKIICVAGALKREIAPVTARFKIIKTLPLAEGALHIADQWHFLVTGIGQDKTSDTWHEYLKHYQPDLVLNIGGAGKLHPKITTGGIYHIINIIDESGGTALAAETIPGLTGCLTASLLTVHKPVTDTMKRDELYRHYQADLVDMEAFFLGRAVRQRGIPFYCIKTVTDSADEQTAADFKKNSTQYAERLAVYLMEKVFPILNNRR
jgi:nucleoside phosphorylase